MTILQVPPQLVVVSPSPMVPPPERMIVRSPAPTFNAAEIPMSAAVIERLEPELESVPPVKLTVPVLFMVTLLKVTVAPEKVWIPEPVNSEVVAKVRVPAEN